MRRGGGWHADGVDRHGCAGKGGKNRRRGKNDNEEKRELVFKEDGQGAWTRRSESAREGSEVEKAWRS